MAIKRLFFFHNPKAGGSSLRADLARIFSPERTCPIIENDPFGHRMARSGYAAFQGYDLYAGHFGYDVYKAVGDGHACVTNFRHPVHRLVSLYNYFRFSVQPAPEVLAQPEYYTVRLAKTVDFETFVGWDDPRASVYTSDHHFRQLANSGWALGATRSIGQVQTFIDTMPWFYMCEFPQLSMRWATAALGWPALESARTNVTPPGDGTGARTPSISAAAIRIVMDRNRRDLAIYRHAADRFLAESCQWAADAPAPARFVARRSEPAEMAWPDAPAAA